MFEFQVCILPSIEEAIIMKENRPATPSGQSTNLTTRKSIPRREHFHGRRTMAMHYPCYDRAGVRED
jgi:hypothetical protein